MNGEPIHELSFIEMRVREEACLSHGYFTVFFNFYLNYMLARFDLIRIEFNLWFLIHGSSRSYTFG